MALHTWIEKIEARMAEWISRLPELLKLFCAGTLQRLLAFMFALGFMLAIASAARA